MLRQLEQAGVALEAFWTPEEFARLLAPEGPEAQPDENTVLAPPTTTTIRRGDVFQLGRHRLACGDATAATDVARLLAGATPCLMVTDPPYGVNYQPAFRHTAYPRQRTAVGRVTNDTQADWAAAYAIFPGDVAYVWHAALFADVVMDPTDSSRSERARSASGLMCTREPLPSGCLRQLSSNAARRIGADTCPAGRPVGDGCARTPRVPSPSRRRRTFPLPVAPTRANVDERRLPAAATKEGPSP